MYFNWFAGCSPGVTSGTGELSRAFTVYSDQLTLDAWRLSPGWAMKSAALPPRQTTRVAATSFGWRGVTAGADATA